LFETRGNFEENHPVSVKKWIDCPIEVSCTYFCWAFSAEFLSAFLVSPFQNVFIFGLLNRR
jgi:hypothetical protein